jgi:YgiT-type zinc finger domain-containing protein
MKVCRSCGSSDTYEERAVSYPLKLNGQIIIFENAPALVCRQCGEMIFRAATVKLMEDLGRGERPPSRMERIPVYDLAEVA